MYIYRRYIWARSDLHSYSESSQVHKASRLNFRCLLSTHIYPYVCRCVVCGRTYTRSGFVARLHSTSIVVVSLPRLTTWLDNWNKLISSAASCSQRRRNRCRDSFGLVVVVVFLLLVFCMDDFLLFVLIFILYWYGGCCRC